jgi:hypothetical protein
MTRTCATQTAAPPPRKRIVPRSARTLRISEADLAAFAGGLRKGGMGQGIAAALGEPDRPSGNRHAAIGPILPHAGFPKTGFDQDSTSPTISARATGR